MNETEQLQQILKLPATDDYLPMDRYRDFRKVFGSRQGKKVLAELLAWGGLFKPKIHSAPVDPYMMSVQEGKANYARKILYVMNNEPIEQSKRSNHVSS